MPLPGETAGLLSHVATAKSQKIADVLATYEPIGDDPGFEEVVRSHCIPVTDLDAPVKPESITRCLSIDGSRQQDVVDNSGTRPVSVGYVRVGACFTDMDEYRALAGERFIDPARIEAMRIPGILDWVMPGGGVRLRGADLDRTQMWRRAHDDFFAAAVVTDDVLPNPRGVSVSLAEALLLLHGAPGAPATSVDVRTCPECGAFDHHGLAKVTLDGGRCPECGCHLYLPDCLGLSTAMSSEASRENALTVTMNTAERLALVAFIEVMLRRDPEELSRTLVVADGPLAAFGPLGTPLTRPLRRYIDAVGNILLDETGRPLLLVGIEKSGEFAAHGTSITNLIEPGHAMRLTNEYIHTHVTGRPETNKPYGADYLYGRRFFYRRLDGQMLTLTVPAAVGVVPWTLDDESSDWVSYPVLRPVIELLESMRTQRFEGAVAPLVFAHQVAALPMGTGQSVLTLVGQEGLGLTQNTRVRGETRRPW